MKRHDIINTFIRKYDYKFYLEIGFQNGVNYNKIAIKHKTGVDPDPNSSAPQKMTSDEYFKNAQERGEKYDIIFIDGLHHSEQVYKDIQNALVILKPNGTIVCHDMNPTNEGMQKVPRETKAWTGDCWKAFVKVRSERNDLEMYVVDTDWGCGVIRRGGRDGLDLKGQTLTYDNLEKNRLDWLNLRTPDEFLSLVDLPVEKYPKIWEITPYGFDRNYGKACNEFCSIIPGDEDWIIVKDYDFMFLTPSHQHLISEIVKRNPEVGLFTCYTNRVKAKKQIRPHMFSNPNLGDHRKEAILLSETRRYDLKDLNKVISGYVMIFQKKVWEEVGGFKDGLLAVDNNFSRKILNSGRKVMLMEGVYGMHYYRFNEGVQDSSHLR